MDLRKRKDPFTTKTQVGPTDAIITYDRPTNASLMETLVTLLKKT